MPTVEVLIWCGGKGARRQASNQLCGDTESGEMVEAAMQGNRIGAHIEAEAVREIAARALCPTWHLPALMIGVLDPIQKNTHLIEVRSHVGPIFCVISNCGRHAACISK